MQIMCCFRCDIFRLYCFNATAIALFSFCSGGICDPGAGLVYPLIQESGLTLMISLGAAEVSVLQFNSTASVWVESGSL